MASVLVLVVTLTLALAAAAKEKEKEKEVKAKEPARQTRTPGEKGKDVPPPSFGRHTDARGGHLSAAAARRTGDNLLPDQHPFFVNIRRRMMVVLVGVTAGGRRRRRRRRRRSDDVGAKSGETTEDGLQKGDVLTRAEPKGGVGGGRRWQ